MKNILIVILICISIYSQGQKDQKEEIDSGNIEKVEGSILEVMRCAPENLNQVNTFEKLELAVELPKSTEAEIKKFIDRRPGKSLNPFDPDQLDVYAEVRFFDPIIGDTIDQRINAFYYEDYNRDTTSKFIDWDWKKIKNQSGFRLRFCPVEVGTHKVQFFVSVNKGAKVFSNVVLFEVFESDHPGFVGVGSTKKYFSYQNGETFFPIGGNIPPEYINEKRWNPRDLHVHGSKWATDPYDTEGRTYHPLFYVKYLERLKTYSDRGANYIRIMSMPWTTDIEVERLNDYGQRMHIAWELDNWFESLDELGLKAEFCIQSQYTLENPGYYKHFNWDWPTNTNGCTNDRNRGNCYQEALNLKDPIEFFTDERAKKNWKKKLRYIFARWGYNPDIALFQFISEINGTGVIPNFVAQEVKNEKGEVIAERCEVDPYKDQLMKPYYDTDDYPKVIYKWQLEMADYIKNELNHTQHLIGPCYGGAPKPEKGDSIFYSDLIDVNSYNLYSPRQRLFFMLENDAREKRKGGVKGKTFRFQDQKPLVFSEIGQADYYLCDQDIGDIKMMLISPFSGAAGMGMIWDNSRLDRSENWYLYGHVERFFEGIDLNNIHWNTASDETSFKEIEYMGEMICLQSAEKYRRAMGIVQNRTWNYYTMGDKDENGQPCGAYQPLGNTETERNNLKEYRDLSYDFPFGPYPLKVDNMGILRKYVIEWIDPFTMGVVKVDSKSSNLRGKLNLEYPEMSVKDGKSPIYFFKAYQKKRGTFEDLPSK